MEGKVILSSSDGQVFEVDMKVAMISQTLSNMLKDTEDTGSETAPINLANVSSRIQANTMLKPKSRIQANQLRI
ncbi:hypothetical protein SUGI_0708490 [Cryptomeria japonica]|nr:hypothetical protein SUGI_0708490 [Cryptomeria japonica]